MALRLLAGSLLGISLALTAQTPSFDKPQFTRTVDLGGAGASGGHAKVTCHFFPSFMVKQVDTGEKGAERLAIVATGKSKDHTCSRLRDQGEKEINSDEWSGYFKGVKGDLVFFDADDGWNGGMGFAIYSAKTGKKVFDDVAFGPLKLSAGADKAVTLSYIRVIQGECVVPKEPAACWNKIKQKLSLDNAPAPDCNGGYENSAQETAKGRCQAQRADNEQCLAKELPLARTQAADAPSVISYPVEVSLDPTPVIKPATGNMSCWPAD